MGDVADGSFFEHVNDTRYRLGQRAGHYESFFQRANHPARPLAFWIRYTLFSPDGEPEKAIGELWAITFDGERNRHVAVKSEVPFTQCDFNREGFGVRIHDAHLAPGRLTGSAASAGHLISWDLSYRGEQAPLLLLPRASYDAKLPRAKSLVGLPMAVYSGSLVVDGERLEIDDWVGSQNHNWGARHTDHYAWGQVAGFDTHPTTFLEVATARLKLGPLWTPFMTNLVMRHAGAEIALNGIRQGLRAEGAFDYFTWRFRSEDDAVRIEGTIAAPRESFVALRYYNPPGGMKHCLNTKIARCELQVTNKRSGRSEALSTRHRAAFEILTDDQGHGIAIRA